MWMQTGYRVADGAPVPDGEVTVLCAGHYRLQHAARFHTARLQGRPDWQLLYIAAGRGRFLIEGQHRWVTAGQAVLYRPGEPQDYTYYAADKPEIYWIHFAGDRISGLLAKYGLTQPLLTTGTDPLYGRLWEQIIRDIQLELPLGEDMTALLLLQLLLAIARGQRTADRAPRSPLIQQAVADFQAEYHTPLSLTAYAHAHHVEPGWFSHLFRRQMGLSPRAYLTELRLTRAAELLRSTDCPVGEVARMVGYEDPLYFSRLFRRRHGASPRGYRKDNVDFSTSLE